MAPLFSRIGEKVLGTRGGGITPEFARILRTQVLEKDKRWILIERGNLEAAPLARDHLFQAKVAHDD